MLDSYALYSMELTEEERDLGFELVELQSPESADQVDPVYVVAHRFSPQDRIIKMNVPVIGGHSFRHERLRGQFWAPVGSVVFPSASMALESISGGRSLELAR